MPAAQIRGSMRKIILSVLISISFFPVFSFAASIGGADTQGRNKFSVGIDSDYVFEKEFEDRRVSWVSFPIAEFYGQETTKIKGGMYREMVKINYGILDNLDIYVKAGTAQIIGMRTNVGLPGTIFAVNGSVERGMDYTSELGMSYAAGLKGKVNLPGKLSDWFLGCDLQYLRQRNRTRVWVWQNLYALGTLVMSGQNGARGHITWEEWQAAPYLAYKWKMFTPYAGAKYSYTRLKIQTDDWFDMGMNEKSGNEVGAFAGLDWDIGKHITLNLEGRFVDETAVSGAVSYKF